MGLHWYEWQCGFSDLCVVNDGAHRFKFDTEYPDYDPPRRGPVFGEVVRELREAGVYTFPYINGRLFDNHSASYKTEDGLARVIKQSATPRLGSLSPEDLTVCTEYYGSQELDGSPAYFFTADPSTAYWQDKCVHLCSADFAMVIPAIELALLLFSDPLVMHSFASITALAKHSIVV